MSIENHTNYKLFTFDLVHMLSNKELLLGAFMKCVKGGGDSRRVCHHVLGCFQQLVCCHM